MPHRLCRRCQRPALSPASLSCSSRSAQLCVVRASARRPSTLQPADCVAALFFFELRAEQPHVNPHKSPRTRVSATCVHSELAACARVRVHAGIARIQRTAPMGRIRRRAVAVACERSAWPCRLPADICDAPQEQHQRSDRCRSACTAICPPVYLCGPCPFRASPCATPCIVHPTTKSSALSALRGCR